MEVQAPGAGAGRLRALAPVAAVVLCCAAVAGCGNSPEADGGGKDRASDEVVLTPEAAREGRSKQSDDQPKRRTKAQVVQLEGGALPLGLSDTVRTLRQRGLLSSTVSQGACFGGEVECVNVASALAWAAATGHQAVVCAVGPGIVGTASRLGHGGVAAAAAANFASALGGSPVLAVRVSSADQRERHRGVSHHTRAVVELCLGDVRIAWPKGLEAPEWLEPREEVDVEGWDEACAGLPLSHMGRGPELEPWFFAAAFAAGRVARGLLP